MASSEQQQHVITEDELNDLLGIVEPEPGDEVVSDLTVLQQENQLYELIEERVSESQIEIPCLKKVIGKLLEDQGVTVGALLNLAQNSLTTPDDVLSQALSSQVSANPPKETKSNKESTVYYIRSITFSVEVMITATNRYKDAYLDDAYCDDLLQELEKVPKGTDVYLRYVGCTSATTPVERHQEDVSSNISTRFGNFHQIMAAFGEVPTTIHELPLLTVEGELGKATDEQRHMIDGTEQTLIHLLGRHVLMNSQPGGYFRDYVPDPQSESVVKNLQLGVVKAHFSDVAMVNDNDEELGDIKYHYTTLHKNLKNMNTPVTTQMAKMLMEPGYIDFLADQAFSGPPANGTMPLMILGKDITYSSFRNKEKFFEGSRAGDITKLLANQVLGASNAFVSSCIHDLWCIPSKRHKDHLPHFIECTSSILRTLDTQLIVTLGYDPAVVAFSKFRDWYGLGVTEYADTIGKPVITNLDTNFNYEDEGYDAEPIGNWVLVIPHLHPGYVSYGPGSPDILKLMYLTWAMTFLLLDVLLDLDYDHTVPLEPGTKAFAERALENLEGRDDYGPLKVELDAIRDKVNTWRREDATGRREKAVFRGSDYGMFDSASASLAQQNLWKRYGFAEGPPNSEPRQKQVKRLQATGWSVFKKQLANVYHGNTEKWRQWLLDLKEKTNIFQSALATIQLGPHGHLKNFPRPPHFAPEDDSWMNDEELVAWSYQEKARQMRAALPAGFFLRERQQYAALKNGHCNRGAVELFIKVPVWVDPTGRAHFSVKVGDHIYRRADGLTVGAAFAGQVVYLDYDPDKSKDSLMVRDKDDGLLPSEADPKKIHAYAVKQRFHPYFQVMQNTAELFGIDEPALKDDAEFQWDKVIKLFLADHCSEGPLQMLTQPSSKLPFLHTFSHLLEETFLKHEDISEGEKKAWRLAASKGVLHIKRHFDDIQKSPPVSKNTHVWTIGQYSPEGQDEGTELFPFGIDEERLKVGLASKKGVYQIKNHEPFIAWWRKYHLGSKSGTMVKVDYTNEADAKEFWTGFSVAVADYDFEYADLLPYYNIKGQKKPQSLNKVFKHYNWNIVKEKAGLYYIQVPADNNPPEIKAPMAIQEAEIDTSSAVVLSWPAPAQSTTTMPSPKGKEPMPPIHTSSSSFGQAGPSAQGGSLAQVGSSGEVGSSGQSESSGDVGSSEQVG